MAVSFSRRAQNLWDIRPPHHLSPFNIERFSTVTSTILIRSWIKQELTMVLSSLLGAHWVEDIFLLSTIIVVVVTGMRVRELCSWELHPLTHEKQTELHKPQQVFSYVHDKTLSWRFLLDGRKMISDSYKVYYSLIYNTILRLAAHSLDYRRFFHAPTSRKSTTLRFFGAKHGWNQ